MVLCLNTKTNKEVKSLGRKVSKDKVKNSTVSRTKKTMALKPSVEDLKIFYALQELNNFNLTFEYSILVWLARKWLCLQNMFV